MEDNILKDLYEDCSALLEHLKKYHPDAIYNIDILNKRSCLEISMENAEEALEIEV